jgi:hypothetical protein
MGLFVDATRGRSSDNFVLSETLNVLDGQGDDR